MLHLFSRADRQLVTVVANSDKLQRGGAIDDLNVPLWIEVAADDAATINTVRGTQPAVLGRLPHSRLSGLRWTKEALLALEWTGSGLPGQVDPEGWRVVRLVPRGDGYQIEPTGVFSQDVREFWAAAEGGVRATLSSPLDARNDAIEVVRSEESITKTLPTRAANISLDQIGSTIYYRDLSTAGFVRQGLADDLPVPVATGEFALGAISPTGVLAGVTARDPGSPNEVCIVDTSQYR